MNSKVKVKVPKSVIPYLGEELVELKKKAPQLKTIKLAEVKTDEYQRYIQLARVLALGDHDTFDPHKVRRPLLSQRADGKYYVVDGQHTLEVLRELGFEYWDCDVASMSKVDEILRYADQHDQVRAVSNLDRLFALAEGYNEPGGMNVDKIVRAKEIFDGLAGANWTYDRKGSGQPDCSVKMTIHTCTGLEEVYDLSDMPTHNKTKIRKPHGKQAVQDTLVALGEAWPNTNKATEPNMIRAMGMVLRTYGVLTADQKKILGANLISNFTDKGRNFGGQNEKRNRIADHMRATLKLAKKGEMRGPQFRV